ncbi:hypothetical protein Tco_0651720 [Tanacetum coccineum]|uniref:Reverse transcriptase domain-containing protein n=1 Tax=Tanacetum coccineum TaxID=301880 RepID=A0ABQ4WVK9_9ASTR
MDSHDMMPQFYVVRKVQKYIEKGGELFLAQVTEQEPKEKRLEDVPVIRDFPEVFPEDLPGLPPPRQVEFRIDLILGAAPVARKANVVTDALSMKDSACFGCDSSYNFIPKTNLKSQLAKASRRGILSRRILAKRPFKVSPMVHKCLKDEYGYDNYLED